jgi:hypothetical protein
MAESSEDKATSAEEASANGAEEQRSEGHEAGATSEEAQQPEQVDKIEQVITRAKDVAYTAVGFGIMATAKIQSTARELCGTVNSASPVKDEQREWLDEQVDRVAEAVLSSARKADVRVEAVLAKVEKKLESYEEQLPGKTGAVLRKARTTGQEAREKVRAKVFSES